QSRAHICRTRVPSTGGPQEQATSPAIPHMWRIRNLDLVGKSLCPRYPGMLQAARCPEAMEPAAADRARGIDERPRACQIRVVLEHARSRRPARAATGKVSVASPPRELLSAQAAPAALNARRPGDPQFPQCASLDTQVRWPLLRGPHSAAP